MISFVMVQKELIGDKNINSNEYRVYTYLLAMYNAEKGCAFPSIETIANNTNLSQSSVKRAVKGLERLKYLEICKRKGLAGNFNIYKNLKHIVDKNTIIKSEVEEAKSKTISYEYEELENTEVEIFENEEIKITKCEKVNLKQENFDNKQKEIDNNRNVRLARAVTDIDKSNFAKIVLSIADETLVRAAIKNFKNKKGKSATFLITMLVDEYFKNGIEFPVRMFNLLKKGLKNPFLEQPTFIYNIAPDH